MVGIDMDRMDIAVFHMFRQFFVGHILCQLPLIKNALISIGKNRYIRLSQTIPAAAIISPVSRVLRFYLLRTPKHDPQIPYPQQKYTAAYDQKYYVLHDFRLLLCIR